jgi:sugar phosphate isomerase/epimerase
VTQSFADDLDAYGDAGADGIGIWEMKLEDDSLQRFRQSGLEAATAVPAVPSILPLPLMEGPADPGARVEAICASISRLAPFKPPCVLFLTGPGDDREAILEGLRAIGAEGARSGIRVALEPIQREFAELWTLVSSIPETVELLEAAGRPELPIMFDTWNLWNTPTLFEDIARQVDRFAGVHIADWRDPPRSPNDRVFPGDGVAGLPAILGALDAAGYDGWYDVEIFSDFELPDSLWQLDPSDSAKRARESFDRVWHQRRS